MRMRTSAQSQRAVDPEVFFLAGSSREGTVAGTIQVERCISSQPLELEALAAMPCMADPPCAYFIHYWPVVSQLSLPCAWEPGGASVPFRVRSCWAQLALLCPLSSPQGHQEGSVLLAPGTAACPGALAVSHRQGRSLRAPWGRSAGPGVPRPAGPRRAAWGTPRWPS